MNKKILIYIVSIFLVSSVLISCDLDTSPTQEIDASKVFETTEGADKVLIGSWSYLMETFYSYANPGFGAFLRTNDAMGSDVVLNTLYGFSSHYGFGGIYNKNGTNQFSWTLTYKVINNLNNIIAKIDNIKGSSSDKARIKSQALTLRGFLYLHFASCYSFSIDKDPNAVCVPIYIEPSSINTKGQPASSVSEVYAQVLTDLEQALVLMPENYIRDSKYKIDKDVILGLLSRASLYSRNWEKARTYSDQLLARNGYLMNEVEYNAGFNDISNNEWIWGHPQIKSQSNASYQFHFLDVTSKESYYHSFNADPYFKDLFDDNDYRKKMIGWGVDAGKNPQTEAYAWMQYRKFKFKKDLIADIVLMRVSEIYLINAEAKAQLGDATAVNSLNSLRGARNANLATNVSGQALIDEVWIERRKELFGEGFSLVDIIRNQQSVVRKEYPQDTKIDYTYTDQDGNNHTVSLTPRGHRIVVFPDQSDFVINSKYYLYRIPDNEEILNLNLYSKYPKLNIYN